MYNEFLKDQFFYISKIKKNKKRIINCTYTIILK